MPDLKTLLMSVCLTVSLSTGAAAILFSSKRNSTDYDRPEISAALFLIAIAFALAAWRLKGRGSA